jgi:hypothetical protein
MHEKLAVELDIDSWVRQKLDGEVEEVLRQE